MKRMSLKLGALALLAGAALFISPTSASADVIRVQIGVPPPPPPVVIERPWAPPYRTAVWIKPHYEAVHGRWVWVRGYYAYPPRVGAYWVEGRYNSRGYWRPGHWAW
jgi:hypothetical protein